MIEKVKEIMATLFEADISDITENIVAGDLEKWDSLHHINLIAALEEEFNVEFDEEEVLDMMSFKLIMLTLNEKLGS